MKKHLIGLCLLLSLLSACRQAALAQQTALRAKGKVFVDNGSKNENAVNTAGQLRTELKEWGYWQLVDSKEKADFQISLDITASKGITLTSWGGTSYVLVARLVDPKGEVLWESDAYKSSPNGSNGFNSSKAVVNKLMRDLKSRFKDK